MYFSHKTLVFLLALKSRQRYTNNVPKTRMIKKVYRGRSGKRPFNARKITLQNTKTVPASHRKENNEKTTENTFFTHDSMSTLLYDLIFLILNK